MKSHVPPPPPPPCTHKNTPKENLVIFNFAIHLSTLIFMPNQSPITGTCISVLESAYFCSLFLFVL